MAQPVAQYIDAEGRAQFFAAQRGFAVYAPKV